MSLRSAESAGWGEISPVFNATILGQVFVNGVSLSAIYILVALGFTLLFGIMRVVNFAHGEFAMLGAFALFYLMKTLQWHWVFALPIGVIGVATASLVLEWLVFRWFYQRMFESMIGLLGLNMMMMFGAVQLWDVHERNIPSMSGDVLMLGDIIIPVDRLIVVIIAVTALAGFYLFIRHTRSGLAMRAAAQDLETAETQGVDTRRTYKIAFFVAKSLGERIVPLHVQRPHAVQILELQRVIRRTGEVTEQTCR